VSRRAYYAQSSSSLDVCSVGGAIMRQLCLPSVTSTVTQLTQINDRFERNAL